ncbi:MAG TPA: DUF2782 domain-containing protein [Gammaproteobacteria bacterium]|nr:DUF2782 domain-containing protein [Gammaproteobacteria bacterium]
MRRLIICLLLAAAPAWAADPRPLPPRPEMSRTPLPMPEVKQGNVPEKEVVITTTRRSDSVEEYRVNGRLYMIKITPAKGFPYYLIDTDGDGDLDTRRNDLEEFPLNQWILFRW